MRWWYVPFGLLDLYLLAALLPALAAQMTHWLLLRSGPFLETERLQMDRLLQDEQRHAGRQPAAPRPGRYGELDASATLLLRELRETLEVSGQALSTLATYRIQPMLLGQVMRLGAWRPLIAAISAARKRRQLREGLARGRALVAQLDELAQEIDLIPERARGLLGGVRAEANRLSALGEAEVEAGTRGLEDLIQQLAALSFRVERGLDELGTASLQRLPDVVLALDEGLAEITVEVESLDQRLAQITGQREQAESAAARIESAVQAAGERWRGLQQLGATEPDISRAIAVLQAGLREALRLGAARTPEAYAQMLEQLAPLDLQLADLESSLARMGDLIEQSRAAIEGDLRALAEAQQACDRLIQTEPLLEPDSSQALIEVASQAYMQAERLHGLGTREGFERSLEYSRQAGEYLQRAIDELSPLPEEIKEARHLLRELSARTLDHWRGRADRLKHELEIYTRHWNTGLGARVGTVLSQLEQVEVDLERMPPNIRYERRFRQSELREGLDLLRQAQASLGSVSEEVVDLEAALQEIEAKREELEKALASLQSRTLPALRQLRDRMLPELAERLDHLTDNLTQATPMLAEPGQVDYDEALGSWLPTFAQELEELHETHQQHVQNYRGQLHSARAELERLWRRLQRLDPEAVPAPSVDVQALADDWARWRQDAQHWQESPARLHELVGQRSRALAELMEQAHTEIVEGRRVQEALARQCDQRLQALNSRRQRIQDQRRASDWPQLDWETRAAREAWTQALALERESRAPLKLEQVIDQLRRALQMIERAEAEYEAIERRMRTGLRRLDGDLRSVTTALARSQREFERLEAGGALDRAAATSTRCVEAERAVERARGAATFEEVLRHLREAGDLLARR
ncbi:MAG: hypothetical protein JXA74_00860 [Anaerolineae bacterium]|nr:hypothetical protein [Anaerolineae bacterium]